MPQKRKERTMRNFVLKSVVVFISCLLFADVDVLGQSDRKLVDSYSTTITEPNGFQWIYTAKKYKKKRHEYTCYYSVSLVNHTELKDEKGQCYYWLEGYGKNCELKKTPPALRVVDLGWAIYVKHNNSEDLFTLNGDYFGWARWSLAELSQKNNPLILKEICGSKIWELLVVSDNKIIIRKRDTPFEEFTYNEGFYLAKIHVYNYSIYSSDGHLIAEKAEDIDVFDNKINDRSLLTCRVGGKTRVFDNLGKTIVPECDEVTLVDGNNGGKLFKAKKGKYSSDAEYGIYDFEGNVIIPCKYKEITSMDDNNGNKLFKVYKDYKYGIYNASGNVLIPCECSEISTIDGVQGEKLLKVKSSNKYGIYYMSGSVLIPCEYWDISTIDGERGEKLFKVKKDYYSESRGIFDYEGNEILAPDFQDCAYLGK